jgi:hypothetical protein
MNPVSLPRLARVLGLAVFGLAAAPLIGCAASTPPSTAPVVALPAPPAGSTAWQVVSNGGEGKYGATVPDASPWITIANDGSIRATIPASEQTKAAQSGLAPEALGALTIRRAP